MTFEDGQWYQGEISNVEYIKSEKKATPAIQLTVNVSDRGEIVGQWWLTDSLVADPLNKDKKVAQWQAAMTRCEMFGCNEAELRAAGWIDHMRKSMIGQSAAVCAKVNDYGDVSAQFIGKPRGTSGKFQAQDAAESPFVRTAKPKQDPFAIGGGISDDDVPF